MVSHKPLSEPQRLLAKHKIAVRMVMRSANMGSEHVVASILSCPPSRNHHPNNIAAVRAAVERLLTAMGEGVNSETLWQEYDQEEAA